MNTRWKGGNKAFRYLGLAKNKAKQLKRQGILGTRKHIIAQGIHATAVNGVLPHVFLEAKGGEFFEWFSWANDPENLSGVIFQTKAGSGGVSTKLNSRVIDPEALTPEYETFGEVLSDVLPVVPPRIHYHSDGDFLRTGFGTRYSNTVFALMVDSPDIHPASATYYVDEDTQIFGPSAYPCTSGHIYKVEVPLTGEIVTRIVTWNMYTQQMVMWDPADPETIIAGVSILNSSWWPSGTQWKDFYFSKDGSRAVAVTSTFKEGAVDYGEFLIGLTELSITVTPTGMSVSIVQDQVLYESEPYFFGPVRVPIAADFSYEDNTNTMVILWAEQWGVVTPTTPNPSYDPGEDPPNEAYYYEQPTSSGSSTVYVATPNVLGYRHVEFVMETEFNVELLREVMVVCLDEHRQDGLAAELTCSVAGFDLRDRALSMFKENTTPNAYFNNQIVSSRAFGASDECFNRDGTFFDYRNAVHPDAILATGYANADITTNIVDTLSRNFGGVELSMWDSTICHPHPNKASWAVCFGTATLAFIDIVPDGTELPEGVRNTPNAVFTGGGYRAGLRTEYNKFIPEDEENQLNGLPIRPFEFNPVANPAGHVWDYDSFYSTPYYPRVAMAGAWVVYKRDTTPYDDV